MFRVAFVGIDNPHGSGWRDLLVNLEDQLQIVALVPGYDGGTTSLEERYAHLPRFDTVDDLLAGVYAAVVVQLLIVFLPQWFT